tara:strand:+ start:1910 stop:4825 length:2916 start_codon:yes stop_codon:yes gene_type:complete
MASVTQLVPTLTGGVSQQPDELKVPGQVNVADNVLPDVTHGLMKRPGGKYIDSLSDGTLNSHTTGKWFHYYRDENEQYIGQVIRNTGQANDGHVRMWRCSDGNEMTVNGNGKAYLQHTSDEDIQTLTVNDFTFLTNRTKTVAMSSAVEPTRPPEVYLELDQIKYASQYSLNLFDQDGSQNSHYTEVSTATRLSVELVRSSNNYCDGSGNMSSHTARVNNTNRCSVNDANGDDRAPNVATRIFDITSGGTLVDDNAVSTQGGTDFSYQVNVYNAAGQSGQTGRANLYFRITCTGQSTPVGSGSNVEYRTRYSVTNDLLYGGEGWLEGDHVYVYMKDGYYKVTVEAVSVSRIQANLGLIRPKPTSFDTKTVVTAESILGSLRTAIVATGNFAANDVKIIGKGIYITRPSGNFNATTTNSRLMNVVSNEVLTVEDLPKQCKHGMVIRIANSASQDDDYYLKFFGNNDKDGEGVWEECVQPGVNIEFDNTTMPLQLVRDSSGNSFTLSEVAWENADVGNTHPTEGTNPRASFVGKEINKMVFFRNRLVMLSDENIIMSRPGNFFNFWVKTATTFSNIDPIDISCSSTYPAIVYDAIQVNAGLLIFTKNQQFMLTTDSDILNPSTAKLNALASYNFNFKTNPISLGTTVGFLDNANKFSRFFEMSRILREGEPDVVEQSKVVSQLFAKEIKLISNSRENNVIFFSEEGNTKLYGYRYFDSGNERVLQSWFSWTLTGTIQYHCMLDDSLHVVVRNNAKDQLLKFPIKIDDSGNFVSGTDTVPIHLDHAQETSGWTYANGKSTKAKPVGLESSSQLAAFDNSGATNLGRYGEITINGSNMELDGDWSGETFIIGYLYDMKVELPTIYYTYQSGENWRSDTRSDLVVHRVKFSFGDVGIYKITLDRNGKDQYNEVREVNEANLLAANSSTFLSQDFETIPTYERNKNLKITVSSKHPSPATLLSYQWEGDYNNRSYKRV